MEYTVSFFSIDYLDYLIMAERHATQNLYRAKNISFISQAELIKQGQTMEFSNDLLQKINVVTMERTCCNIFCKTSRFAHNKTIPFQAV